MSLWTKFFNFALFFALGQDMAKRALSVAVYNHYKRIYHNIPVNKKDSDSTQRQNVQQHQHLNLDRDFLNIGTRVPDAAIPMQFPNTSPPVSKCSFKEDILSACFKSNECLYESFFTFYFAFQGGAPVMPPGRPEIDAENFARIAREREELMERHQQKLSAAAAAATPPSATAVGSDILDAKKHDLMLEKSNIMMFGSTGSGKTLLAQTIAKCLDVPFAICDCTTLTMAGYVGDDIETVVAKLLQVRRWKEGGEIISLIASFVWH